MIYPIEVRFILRRFFRFFLCQQVIQRSAKFGYIEHKRLDQEKSLVILAHIKNLVFSRIGVPQVFRDFIPEDQVYYSPAGVCHMIRLRDRGDLSQVLFCQFCCFSICGKHQCAVV